jgi:hypothetical protein
MKEVLQVMAGRKRKRNIKIREDRLSKLDGPKMEVAVWLLAKGKVEDRTKRAQPAPLAGDEVNLALVDGADTAGTADTREAA